MPRHKSCNMLIQWFSQAGQREGLLGEAIFMVESCWQGPRNKLSSSKHTQPQHIGDLYVSALRNNICGQQDIKTADIASNALSIALASTKQLVNIRSGHRLSPSSSIVRLPKELIILTLRPNKRLTNTQLRSKLLFTLQQLVNKDQVCL